MRSMMEQEKLHDECGVFGIYAPGTNLADICYLALYALQHRGQESAGIAIFQDDRFQLYKNTGLVSEVFNEKTLSSIKCEGNIALAHCRYPAEKEAEATIVDAQPMVFNYLNGLIGMTYNGSLVNYDDLRYNLALRGSVFQTNSDCELMMNLIASYAQDDLPGALAKVMLDAKGAYAIVAMMEDKLVGMRDPHGIRPLCLGKLDGHFMLASESCAIDAVGGELVRDIAPGEIVVIDKDGFKSYGPYGKQPHFCIFEHIYIARPDSTFDGVNVYLARHHMGKILARESNIDADIVIPVPDSGVPCALGYSEESGLPYRMGLLKNRYIGRTFIQPTQIMRDKSVHLKLNPIKETLQGKRVVVVDDSLVRGTTSRQIISMLREAGAIEVHLVLGSPPVKFGCPYGIDTKPSQLIAVKQTKEQICEYIGADSLHYLSIEGMLQATRQDPNHFCTACFSGEYIVKPCPFQNKK